MLLVAEVEGSVAGAVSVRWQGTCDPPPPWLYALPVRPDARRHGVGALLARGAEAVAALDGAAHVEHARSDQSAEPGDPPLLQDRYRARTAGLQLRRRTRACGRTHPTCEGHP